MLPALPATDDVIVELLHLLRGSPGADGFDDEEIVVFGVETAVDRVIVNKLFHRSIVIVNDCVLTTRSVFEHDQPVVGKDFAVVDYQSQIMTSFFKHFPSEFPVRRNLTRILQPEPQIVIMHGVTV